MVLLIHGYNVVSLNIKKYFHLFETFKKSLGQRDVKNEYSTTQRKYMKVTLIF